MGDLWMDLKALSSPDWRERRQAVERLEEADEAVLAQTVVDILRKNHQDLGAVNAALQTISRRRIRMSPALARLLEEPDPETRLYAALALGELSDPDHRDLVVSTLLKSLDDPDPNVQFNAIEALGKLRVQEAVLPLERLLHGQAFPLTFSALEALALIGDPHPAPILTELLTDSLLGLAAAQALGALGPTETSGAALSEWLELPQGEAEAAVLALVCLGERAGLGERCGPNAKASPGIQAEQPATAADLARQAALRAVAGAVRPQGQQKLLAEVEKARARLHGAGQSQQPQAENPDQPEARAYARETRYLDALAQLLGWLLELDPQDADLQAALLNLFDLPGARPAASKALACAGVAAVPGLCLRLGDADAEVRHAAARTLGEIANPGANPSLYVAFESATADEDATLASLAARAIGRSGDRTAYQILERHLSHPQAGVRQAIASALYELAHPEHQERMAAHLAGRDPLAQTVALNCLALEPTLAGADRLRMAVLDLFETPNPAVLKEAVEVLPLFHHPQADAALAEAQRHTQPAVRAAAARALARVDPASALPRLYTALYDTDPWTRLNACRSLGRHGRGESLDELARLVADPAPPVRIALIEALLKIGGPSIVGPLRALLSDPELEVRQAAEDALALVDGPAL